MRSIRALGWALAFACTSAAIAAAQPSLVFVVRHAEKAPAPADDPPLTLQGQTRVRALVEALADAGIAAVISTPFRRTRDTAAPVAHDHGVDVQTVAMDGGVAAHARAVADAVRRVKSGAVLVVGHSNTVGPIIKALGGPAVRDLCDEEYDQLFVLELAASSKPRLTRARFGEPSVRTGCPPVQAR